jgi:hypothetical protein
MAENMELQLGQVARKPGTKPTQGEIDAIVAKHPLLGTWSKLWEEAHGHKRAFVIELAGMPKAGKSTTIDQVRHFFSHGHKVKVSDKGGSPYIVHTPAEGVSQRTPRALKDDRVDFNTWAGAYALQELLEARHDTFHDLVILDRGPWDASCWLQHFAKVPGVDKDLPVGAIADFFRLKCWVTESDLHVVMIVDPATALTRERTQRLIEHRGPASQTELMDSMKKIYEDSFPTLLDEKAKACKDVGKHSAILLNTTAYDRQGAAEFEVISQALKVLELKIERLLPETAEARLKAFSEQLSGKIRGSELTKVHENIQKVTEHLRQMTPLQRFGFRQALAKRTKGSELILSARGEAETITRVLGECISEAVSQ